MEKHYRILGYLLVIWGVWTLISMLIIAFAPGVFRATPIQPNRVAIAIAASVLIAGFYAMVGWSLLARKEWSRSTAIAASIIALFNFPFGTALGVYGLWVTLSQQGRQQFRPYVGAAQF